MFVRGLIFFSFGLKVGANFINGPEVVVTLIRNKIRKYQHKYIFIFALLDYIKAYHVVQMKLKSKDRIL